MTREVRPLRTPGAPDQPGADRAAIDRAAFDRIAAAFERVRARPHSEQEAALREVCAGDRTLEADVRDLLRHHEAPADLLDQSVLQPDTARIGPYRLERRLGEGGMGAVWLAHQERPVERRVALKVIKTGMDTRAVVQRFETERRVLARMDHPGIARVLDAGATPDGRPYFAMEFVDGQRLLEWCDDHRLGVRERLLIFIDICRAVAHAHTKGVLHRDLKPSNILVTEVDGRPVPKVIDFGVAKALDERAGGATLLTNPGSVIGTPEYMSPEQSTPNGDVDTRSDLYSLGVVLYELLTGITPSAASRTTSRRGATHHSISGLLRGDAPIRPSSALEAKIKTEAAQIAEFRSSDARALRRALRGDLDWVVLRAVAPEPARRYDTVAALAEDLHRVLVSEAVEARPPSFSYLASKFARRHAGALVATGAVAVALVVGLAVAIDGWRAANIERDAAVLATEREQATSRSLADRLHEAKIEQGRAAATSGNVWGAREILWTAWRERPDCPIARWALRECYLRHPSLAAVPFPKTPPFAVAFLDSTTAVAALAGAPPVIVDLATATVRERLPGDAMLARDMAIDSSGRWMVVGDADGRVHAWDLASKQALGVVSSHGEGAAYVAAVDTSDPPQADGRFSTGGADGLFITGGADGRVVLISLFGAAPRVLHEGRITSTPLRSDSEDTEEPEQVTGSAAAPPVSRLAAHSSGAWVAGFGDGTLLLVDANGAHCELEPHARSVFSLAFSHDGTRVASGCLGREIKLHDVASAQTIDQWSPDLGTVRDLRFIGDSAIIVAGWWDLSTLDIATGEVRRLAAEPAWRIALSPDGRSLLIVTGASGSLRLWSLETLVAGSAALAERSQHVDDYVVEGDDRAVERSAPTAQGLRSGRVLVFDSSGAEIAGFDGYDPGTRHSVALHVEHDARGERHLSLDRSLVAFTAVGGGVRLRSLDGSVDRHLIQEESNEILSIAFDPDGRRLAVSARRGTTHLVDLDDWRVTELRTPSTIFATAFSCDGSLLACGSWRGGIEIFDSDSTASRVLRGHGRIVDCLVAHPLDPAIFLSGDGAGVLRVWDARKERCLLALEPFDPPSAVRSIEVSDDGDRVRAVGADGRVAAWRWSDVDRRLEANRAHEEALLDDAVVYR